MKKFFLLLFLLNSCSSDIQELQVNEKPIVIVDKWESPGKYGSMYYIKCFTGKDVLTYSVSKYQYDKLFINDTLKSYTLK
jgi:hypothetical protein